MEINRIYNEDCLVGMKRIPNKSVDMILCDLPYGTTACAWDTIIPFEPLWEQYERVIKDNGAIVLTASQPFTSALVMSKPELFKHEWIWDKKMGSNFWNSKKHPMKVHESVLVFGEGNKYYPIMTKGKMRWKGSEKEYDVGGVLGSYQKTKTKNDLYYPKTIIEISNASRKNKFHPTQKPVSLFEYLIKTYTNKNETVLDNCMGSGTTAIACMNTERNYIGFELDETYYEKSLKRIKNHATQTDVYDFM